MFNIKKPSGDHLTHKVELSGRVTTVQKPHNKKLILLVVVFLILLAAAGYFWYTKQQSAKTAKNPVCAEDLLHQAEPLLDSSKREQLKPLVDNIKSKKNYDKDANCLYIVVTYHVNMAEGKNARKYFEQLKQIYDPNKRFSLTVGKHGGIEDLQLQVEYAEAREKIKVTPRYAPSH